MLLRNLSHPLALTILSVSFVCAAGMAVWAPWSGRAPWLAAWGVLAYGMTVIIAARRRHLQPRAVTVEVTAPPASSAPALIAPAPPEDLVGLTGEALRHLNNPPLLAGSGLFARLPLTVEAALEKGSTVEGASPLERARAMRLVLEASIERLKPATESGTTSEESVLLQYAIIHEEYVRGSPNTQIMARHSIGEGTFYNYRRQAILALAGELASREQQLRQSQPGG